MTEEIIKINNNTVIKVTRHENGNIESKATYVNNIIQGVETEWDKNGQKWSETMWRDDVMHGAETYWREDGSKRGEAMRLNGEKHGRETDWWDNGRKRRQLIHWNYDLQGVTTIWRKDGKKKEEVYYSHDEEIGGMKWDEEGKVTKVKFPPPYPSFKQTTNPNPSKNPIKIIPKPHNELVYINQST